MLRGLFVCYDDNAWDVECGVKSYPKISEYGQTSQGVAMGGCDTIAIGAILLELPRKKSAPSQMCHSPLYYCLSFTIVAGIGFVEGYVVLFFFVFAINDSTIGCYDIDHVTF